MKIKVFRYREILQKYFLRYYYNSIYIKKLENFNNKIEKEDNAKTNENEDINDNKYKDINELRIEHKDKHLYTEEELRKIKRNKELRDLFYNKIRERQNYLHKCFTRFYYKGLMLYMKNLNSPKNQSPKKDNNPTNNNPINEINKTNINIEEKNNVENKSTNNNNIIKEPETNLSNPENPYSRARGLRKLLNRKAKEKIELLRKYFYKFQRAGILLALRKGTKRANLYKKMEGIDLETAFNTVKRSHSICEIEIDENICVEEFKEALDKKREDKKLAEELEKNKIEEERRKKEVNKIQNKAIEILLNRADKYNKTILKKNFEIFYLKSKIMSLNEYDTKSPKKQKKSKSMKRRIKKRKTVAIDNNAFKEKVIEFKTIFSNGTLQEVKSEDENDNDNNSENEENIKKDDEK